MSMAYPLAARFRTGTTLAMFTLVVFTLVTGTASNGSFVHAIGVEDLRRRVPGPRRNHGHRTDRRHERGAAPSAGRRRRATSRPSAASRCSRSKRSRSGQDVRSRRYLVRGLDTPFLEHTTFGLGDIARGYGSEQEVWAAVRERPGLAVVDSMIAPRRDNWTFGVLPDFRLSGFYFEEGLRPDPGRGPRQADGQADDA